MGVGRPFNTALLGCCPLPGKDSALSYSLVRVAPLHAVFSNTLEALFRSTRAPTSPAPFDFSRPQEQVLLVVRICRLRLCRAEPNYCSLVAVPPPCPCLHLNSFGDPRKRFSLGCQPLDSKRMLRCIFLSSRMADTRFAKLLRELGCSCSTPAALTRSCPSEPEEVTLWPRMLAQCRCRMLHTFCPSHFCLRGPITCVLALRSAIVVPCASMHEDAPESVPHASIARPSRPIPVAT